MLRRSYEVRVVIDEPRNHRLPTQIESLRRGAGELGDLLVFPYCDDAPAFDSHRLGNCEAIIDGDDLTVDKD